MAKPIKSKQKRGSRTPISDLPELIRPRQLCDALGINLTTLWRWHKKGIALKRITVGALVMYARADVLEFLASQKHQGL